MSSAAALAPIPEHAPVSNNNHVVVPPSPKEHDSAEDAAFMNSLEKDLPNIVSFASLLDGDLHDDELHGMLMLMLMLEF